MKAMLVVSLLSLGACAIDDVDPADEVTAVPRLASNALTPAQLANAQLNANALTTANLNTMAATADGRASLVYVVGCALASGTSVTANVGGLIYKFNGQMGMVPAWTTRALTLAEQHWISGCVLGRVNKSGLAITISLRGAQAGLATTTSELGSYNVEEGAFFGNVYQGADFAQVACMGAGQAASETYGDLPNRDCTEQDLTAFGATQCGFVYAGLCADVCGVGRDGTYADCGSPVGTFPEAVTTYLYGAL